MIDVRGLTYTYPGKKFDFKDFAIARGEHCLLLGESGCGKTTLLHLLGGFLRNGSGTIRINEQEINSFTESELDRFRGQNLGFIFQKNHLITALDVTQNLLMAPYLSGQAIRIARVNEVLQKLNLTPVSSSRISALSQGQAQRVAIARAVMNEPPIILADEPTSALDDKNCNAVMDLLLNVASENNSTLIIATHDSRLKSRINKQIQL